MRKFLALFLLAVPFVSSAQAGPQMQISNLQTGAVSYSVGQEITGSFIMNNVGDVNIPDVQYHVAVGNYGEDGGVLDNETTVTPISESIYLPIAARLEVPFSITPKNLPAGDIGLHVYATQKNGMILGWSKIPLEITGSRNNATQVIEGYYALDGEEYSLQSNAPFASDEIPSFFIRLPEGAADGARNIRLAVYDKNIGQEKLYEEVISVEFVDGEAQVLLPENLKPKQYAGQVSLEEGSNTLALSFSIAGPQAEVLEVDTDLLSLKKGQNFVMTLAYADTPLNARDPEATEYPENLSVRIKVLNEKGAVVSEHDQALEVTQKQDLLEVDENSTEEEQEEAMKRLEKMFNNERILDIPMTADTKAKNLSFEVELYDAKTGEVYDTYKTTFPAEPEAYPARLVLLATLAVILVLLIALFKTAKHKIPMVCLALVLGSAVLAGLAIDQADARIASYSYSPYNSHSFSFSDPVSSLIGGYDVGEAIPLTVTVTARAWPSNGFLAHFVKYPIQTNTWSSFSSAAQALSHAQNNHKNESLYAVSLKNGTFEKFSTVGPYYYAANGSSAQAPNLSPGMHWIPVVSRFCTASHGCSGYNYAVWEICVNGIGVCPGETQTTDVCPYINGVLDSTVQTSVPSGYTKFGTNCTNSCVATTGQSCGCANTGTVQCDGSCSGEDTTSCTAGELSASCTVNPSSFSSPTTATFTAGASNAQGTVNYQWDRLLSGGGWSSQSETSNVYSQSVTNESVTMRVTVTDNTTSDTELCTTTYNTTTCPGPQPSACHVCNASNVWENMCTETEVITDFNFEPNIVAAGGSCKVKLTAENASSCRLVRAGATVHTFLDNPDLSGDISVSTSDNQTVQVGTYRLECMGIDPDDTSYETITTKQCIAAPVLREF